MGREFSNPTVDCGWCGHRHGVRYCWNARCVCGWVGPRRWGKHNARHDAHTHQQTDGAWVGVALKRGNR